MNLSIIVPLYNEEKLVITVLDNLSKLKLPEFVSNFEVVVVDDCSSDNSNSSVSEFIKNKDIFKLYKHDVNKGKGAAVRTGIKNATGDVYLVQDSDLELSTDDIPSMLNAMHKLKVEFINGSRYMPGIIRPLFAFKRYIANKFFTMLTSLFVDVRITDMACGYKLFHKNLYNKFKLNENRFGFEAEIILKALRYQKNNIAEVPVQYFPRNVGEGKKLRNSDAFKILRTIIKYGLFKRD